MDAVADPRTLTQPGSTHHQAMAVLDDRNVLVDAPLVSLIEVLHERGFTTLYSCQETASPHGRWIDEPDKPRFSVSFPDVDQLRSLLPLLEQSETLARSIRPCLGSPRWEYMLTHRGGGTGLDVDTGPLRLQVSVFIPLEHLSLLVETVRLP